MDGAGSLTGPVGAVATLMVGELATIMAVIAVAVFGLLMLGGRTDFARGGRVLLGCAVIFGAPALAAGLLGAVQGPPPASPPVAVVEPVVEIAPRPPARVYDPYSGASVPER